MKVINYNLIISNNKHLLENGLLTNKSLLPTIKNIGKQLGIIISKKKKSILIYEINNILKFHIKALYIQSWVRSYFVRKWISLHGPSWDNISLVNNSSDFLTMEAIKSIHWSEKFNFQDSQGFIYSFHKLSFQKLLKNKLPNKSLLNPYNKVPISNQNITFFKKLMKYTNMLGISLRDEDDENLELNETCKEKAIRRANELFYFIDNLGNYSDSQWFLNLEKPQLRIFIREIIDIWHYRAGLTIDQKIEMCPSGNPFINMNNVYFSNDYPIEFYQNCILDSLFKLVTSSPIISCQNTAALYVLGALTMVNPLAAQSLPWLYESFIITN